MRLPWRHKPKQVGVFTRLMFDVWNANASREAAKARDRLAEFCVKEGVRPRYDTLRFVVHMPVPFTHDMYNDFGSVAWRIELA